MKHLTIITLVIFMAMTSSICSAQVNKKNPVTDNKQKVEAFYFHLTARCTTCKTVEAQAKNDILVLYGNKVSFQSVNIDEPAGKTLAEKFRVPGQALILVKGSKQINITNEGFMYAQSDPEKFKSIIKEKVDGLLK